MPEHDAVKALEARVARLEATHAQTPAALTYRSMPIPRPRPGGVADGAATGPQSTGQLATRPHSEKTRPLV
jgi:hypothetical protein